MVFECIQGTTTTPPSPSVWALIGFGPDVQAGGGSGAVLTPPLSPGQFAIVNPGSDGLINGEASANAVQRAFDALWILRGNWNDSNAEGVLFSLNLSAGGLDDFRIDNGLAFVKTSIFDGTRESFRFVNDTDELNIYSLFSPPDPTLDRIDLVKAQANPDTGVVIPAVVTGTPAASVPQITRFLQTGAPTSGTFKVHVVYIDHAGGNLGLDLNDSLIHFDDDEAALQSNFDDGPLAVVVSGNANDFTVEFSDRSPGKFCDGLSLTVTITDNTMDGGGDYTISNNQEASGPSAPSLPDNALELGRVFVPATVTDATQWIVDLSQVVHASIVPKLSELPDIDGDGSAGDSLVKKASSGYSFTPNLRWSPAKYVGTWSIGTPYFFGNVVRANNSGTWQLYISLDDTNTGHDPTNNASYWRDVVDSGQPVIIQGTANPNTYGEANRITQYSTGGATGGTFDLGTALAIAFDAVQADIQAALDVAYGAGKTVATGNANDANFTVESYGLTITIDGTNLTGGTGTTQVDTQAQIVGGFVASDGSVYIYSGYGDFPVVLIYNSDLNVWSSRTSFDNESAKSLLSSAGAELTRSGSGAGDAEYAGVSRRNGAGNGYATINRLAARNGTGTGGAQADTTARVMDTAVGEASATLNVQHHTGGLLKMGPEAHADGVHAYIDGPIPTADPHVAGELFVVDAAGLAAALGGGAVYVLRSQG